MHLTLIGPIKCRNLPKSAAMRPASLSVHANGGAVVVVNDVGSRLACRRLGVSGLEGARADVRAVLQYRIMVARKRVDQAYRLIG